MSSPSMDTDAAGCCAPSSTTVTVHVRAISSETPARYSAVFVVIASSVYSRPPIRSLVPRGAIMGPCRGDAQEVNRCSADHLLEEDGGRPCGEMLREAPL